MTDSINSASALASTMQRSDAAMRFMKENAERENDVAKLAENEAAKENSAARSDGNGQLVNKLV